MIDFDSILKVLGKKAWSYQFFLTFAMYWNAIPFGMHTLAPVFYTPPNNFSCNISNYNNVEQEVTTMDQCNSPCFANSSCTNVSTPYTADLVYDRTTFTNTVLMEFQLVCSRKIFISFAISSYMLGMWFGSIIFGYISDRFGRKPALLLSTIMAIISSMCLNLTNNIWLFISIRFLVGMFCYPMFMISFVYVMEINYRHRTAAGLLMHIPFAIGHGLNSLFAFYCNNWRHFNIVISVFFIPYLFFHWLVPESPRWLFSNNRNSQGIKVAEKFFEHAKLEPDQTLWEKSRNVSKAYTRNYSSIDLFKPRRMRYVTVKVMIIWFACSILFYSLSLNVGKLYGNIFINNALNAAVEVMVSLFVLLIFDRIGRRILLCVSVLWAGMCCIVNGILILTFQEDKGMYVSLLGKLGAAGAFHILYNFTAELYPTVVRSNSIAMGSMAARIGSICTPFIMRLDLFVAFIPDFVYGAVAIVAGVLAITLPETAGSNLPQTITEAEIMYLRSKSPLDNNDKAVEL